MIASAQTSNSKLAQINNKLTVQSQNFSDDSCAIRSLDWDRSRFDIEFGLRMELLTIVLLLEARN